MKVKDIFCLNLKTFKNDEEWCFLLWNIFSHFRHTQVFVQKLMESQTVQSTATNSKFEYLQKYWMDGVQNLAPVMYIR